MTTALHTRERVVTRAPGDAGDPTTTRTIPVIASTAAIDSYGEIVDPSSWRLDRFLKAPIALRQHCPWEDPVGFFRNVRVEGDALRADLVLYAGKADPEGHAEAILARYVQGGPISVSVGFCVGRSETEDREGRTVRVLYDCELHEISVVTIGANPDAVALRARRALARARRGRMTFEEYLKERGMTAQECASATGLAEDVVMALMGGTKPDDAMVAALATGLGLTEDEVMAMFPAPATEPASDGGAETEVVIVADDAGKALAADLARVTAQRDELYVILGVKEQGPARARVKALLHTVEESKRRGAQVKTLDAAAKARAVADAEAAEARKCADLIAAAQRDGRLTKARQALAAPYLATLKSSVEVSAYLDTLTPDVDPEERTAPPLPTDKGAPFVTPLATEIGKSVGITPEKIADAHAANERRRAARTPSLSH